MDDIISQLTQQFSQRAIYNDSITTVELSDAPVDVNYFSGTFRGCVGSYFFKKEVSTADNDQILDQIQLLSNRSNSPFVLRAKLGRTFDGLSVIGYRFDHTFQSYAQFIPKAFASQNDILHPWWMRELGNLLRGIGNMHSEDVFHTLLHKDESYVVRDNGIYIVGPLMDGAKLSTADKEFRKAQDMLDFIQFLVKYISGKSIDWDLFQEIILDGPSEDIKIFLNHPLLKNSSNYLIYIRQTYDCIGRHMNVNVSNEIFPFWNEMIIATNNKFNNWNTRLTKGTFLYDCYFKKPDFAKEYDPTSYPDLLRFIGNALSHARGDGPSEEEKFEREVNKAFPGFFSYIHMVSALPQWLYLRVAREYTETSNMKEE